MQNSKPVAYFFLVDFCEGPGSHGYLRIPHCYPSPRVPTVFRVTGGKQSQLLVLGLSLEASLYKVYVRVTQPRARARGYATRTGHRARG